MARSQSRPGPADNGWEADLIQSVPDEAWAAVHRRALSRLRRRAAVALVSIPVVALLGFLFGWDTFDHFPLLVVFGGAVFGTAYFLWTLGVDIWGTVRREPLLLTVEILQAIGDEGASDSIQPGMGESARGLFGQLVWLSVIVDVAEARELGRNGPGARIREFETCRRITFNYRLFNKIPFDEDTADAVLVCGSKGRAVCRLRNLIRESNVAPTTSGATR